MARRSAEGPRAWRAVLAALPTTVLALLLVAGPASGTCVGDANADGRVTINELIIAVNNALNGCPDLDISSADLVRGGLLYDKWWVVNGSPTPAETMPLYLTTQGTRTGSITWRCKECHGWDYRGVDGAYGAGSHFTGVPGVIQGVEARTNQELFDAIKSGTPPASDGSSGLTDAHAFVGNLSDEDVLDLVRFLREGLVDMTVLIDSGTKASNGDPNAGQPLFATAGSGKCALCHGSDGRMINFGDEQNPEFVGTVASDNPWESLHKIRWGHPGSVPGMPSTVASGVSLTEQNDILAYSQTLPDN